MPITGVGNSFTKVYVQVLISTQLTKKMSHQGVAEVLKEDGEGNQHQEHRVRPANQLALPSGSVDSAVGYGSFEDCANCVGYVDHVGRGARWPNH